MSDPRRRFDPSEIDLEIDPEGAELLATARDLESYAASGFVTPTVGFEDRVMAAIADEPMPRPAGRGLIATARDAWTIAFGPGRPVAMRAQAFGMLLALALAVGSISAVAVVGASRLLSQGPTPPTVPSPMPSPSPSPSMTPAPTPSPSTDPSATPTRAPSASPSETVEPSGTDDHGGGGSGGSGGSGSGSGSGGGGGSDDSGHSGKDSGGSGGSGGSGSDDSSGGSSGSDSGSDDSSGSHSGHDG
jgi:hypothetical protein